MLVYNCIIFFYLDVGFERILCLFFVYGCMIFYLDVFRESETFG